MGKNGSKLSKRDGEVHVGAYRELGYEPEALLNFIALMGYNHRVEKSGEEAQKLGEGEALDEVKTMQELIDEVSAADAKLRINIAPRRLMKSLRDRSPSKVRPTPNLALEISPFSAKAPISESKTCRNKAFKTRSVESNPPTTSAGLSIDSLTRPERSLFTPGQR